MEEYLSKKNEMEEEIIVQNCNKDKLKTKRLSKIIVLDEKEPSVQSAHRTKAAQSRSWENVFKTQKLATRAYISEKKYWI